MATRTTTSRSVMLLRSMKALPKLVVIAALMIVCSMMAFASSVTSTPGGNSSGLLAGVSYADRQGVFTMAGETDNVSRRVDAAFCNVGGGSTF